MENSSTAKKTPLLWKVYGYTYDGLLEFWPYRNLISEVLRRSKIKPNQRVLDLGCGTGNLLIELLKTDGVSVRGIDFSSSMLKIANKKLQSQIAAGRATLIKSDLLTQLKKEKSNEYDLVASVNVIYAINERSELWQEILRVLKPSGQAVITTSTHTGSGPIIKEHLAHESALSLFRPKLLGVFAVDVFINAFGSAGKFEFPNEDTLRNEVKNAGGTWGETERCYGGTENGVNILFSVTRR